MPVQRMKAIEKELKRIQNAENRMRTRAEKSTTPAWKKEIEQKVPEKVLDGLQKAFAKAFSLIFEKGAGIIEKSYHKETLEKEFLIRDYAIGLTGGKKELRRIRADAAAKRTAAALGTAVEGIGLGALGIGVPDIALWLGVLLRGIYETALLYGYDYRSAAEKLFILKIMEASMQRGAAWVSLNQEVDACLCREEGERPTGEALKAQIEKTALAFATDMLVMKFIQGIPIVGIVGGAANPVFYQKVMGYAQLKYRKRYLLSKMRRQPPPPSLG